MTLQAAIPVIHFDSIQNACSARQAVWDGAADKLDLGFYATELGGEVGEALNITKKLERAARGLRGSRAKVDELLLELADVVICTYNIGNALGVPLGWEDHGASLKGETMRYQFGLPDPSREVFMKDGRPDLTMLGAELMSTAGDVADSLWCIEAATRRGNPNPKTPSFLGTLVYQLNTIIDIAAAIAVQVGKPDLASAVRTKFNDTSIKLNLPVAMYKPGGTLVRIPMLNRRAIQQHPEVFYVFGDNVTRQGMGGQAKEARGEPNAIGVATKWRPDTDESAYFTDDPEAARLLLTDLRRIEIALAAGRLVCWPQQGIGTGLSQLPKRAPKLAEQIDLFLQRMAREYVFKWEEVPTNKAPMPTHG